jgi:hypothetical protein
LPSAFPLGQRPSRCRRPERCWRFLRTGLPIRWWRARVGRGNRINATEECVECYRQARIETAVSFQLRNGRGDLCRLETGHLFSFWVGSHGQRFLMAGELFVTNCPRPPRTARWSWPTSAGLGVGFAGLHGSNPVLHLASEVGNNAQHALKQHELAPVVHFVLLNAHQHLEP